MIKSMTGYGRGGSDNGDKSIQIEIRSVNHRYLDINVRLSKKSLLLEERVKNYIKKNISRGKVDVYIKFDENLPEQKKLCVDKNIAYEYYDALKQLMKDLSFDEELNFNLLAGLPGIFTLQEPEEDEEKLWQEIFPVLDKALSNLIEMRTREGMELANDINKKINIIEKVIQQIKSRAPEVITEYRSKLLQKVETLVQNIQLDLDRIETEVVIFAEKSCIDEEIVRLFSHLKLLRECLDSEHPVGRKMDFVIQEIYREINTIGSKSNDVFIANAVVEVKSEIEKIREQVQNIE
ncbi:MAG: hypothetical protein PWQ82_1820 [Thermosediminibacterales bacterium]|nr:hypothetical protein [Thermosediminibacterales bacterium]MDK2836069.1 hypothetical protein [Thermosediminibacterales bacterium]